MRRLRLASSSGADFTSSSSCRIMLPIRITLAGCSTRSVSSRRSSPSSSLGRPGSTASAGTATGWPSGPTTITCCCPDCSSAHAVHPTNAACAGRSGDQQDLADVLAALHQPVRLGRLRERQRPCRRPAGPCRRRPAARRARRRRRRWRPSPRPAGRAAWWRSPRRACAAARRGRARPWCRPASRSRRAGPRWPAPSTLRREVRRAHVVEDHVGAVAVGRLAHDLDEVLLAVVDRDVGAELAAERELLRRAGGGRAPGRRARAASWIAKVPMPPAPPCTRNVSPGRSPATMNTLDQTVPRPRAAPRR